MELGWNAMDLEVKEQITLVYYDIEYLDDKRERHCDALPINIYSNRFIAKVL